MNTIRSMEGSGASSIAGRATNVQAVQRALEAAGVEFLNHGQPGVRLKAKPSGEKKRNDGVPLGNVTDPDEADQIR